MLTAYLLFMVDKADIRQRLQELEKEAQLPSGSIDNVFVVHQLGIGGRLYVNQNSPNIF